MASYHVANVRISEQEVKFLRTKVEKMLAFFLLMSVVSVNYFALSRSMKNSCSKNSYLYTLSRHSAGYLTLTTDIIEGYGRTHAWRTRIMRVSPLCITYVTQLLGADKPEGAVLHLRKSYISLQVSGLRKVI